MFGGLTTSRHLKHRPAPRNRAEGLLLGILLREREGQKNGLGAERRGRGSVGKMDYACMFCSRFASLDITRLSWIRNG